MDVTTLRTMLMEIGQEQFNTVVDEERIVSTNGIIYPLYNNIVDVIGVWKVTDTNKTTNLYSSHTKTNITVTGANAGDRVLVTYVVAEGLNDDTATNIINWSRYEVLADLNDFTLDLDNPSTDLEKIASVYHGLLALANAYLIMNNINFIQADANISLFNFQTLTKLWGEGMSTDALFMRLFERIEKVRRAAMFYTNPDSMYEPPSPYGFWNDDHMIKDWLTDRYGGVW